VDAARSYWPIGYDDLESYHDKFEGVSGAWGKAGKLQGKKIVGGNSFEAPRSSEFPNPPLTPSHNMVSFEKAARDLGYQSFSVPASSASRRYVNPDGVALGDVIAAASADVAFEDGQTVRLEAKQDRKRGRSRECDRLVEAAGGQ
jgi:choline dehydrogenase-like flavoprotein